MKKEISSKEIKAIELDKYKKLVMATLDYCLENPLYYVVTSEFDSRQHYIKLKKQAEEHYSKGRLSRLKQWFRDLTEGFIEAKDFRFNNYLRIRTNSDINIFIAYYTRIDKIMKSNKITTDNQFYDISMMVDHLCQNSNPDKTKIDEMNNLLRDYEKRKLNKILQSKKPDEIR
ncbi:hypothetical protein [Pedobacter frigoris]|uniref:hypothetical protein n=1 Tax=Pedobacter frigoris TaxID=2571272 RepID=UPI002930559B|nr:hypothetical protein [Pedobacter frigoris]